MVVTTAEMTAEMMVAVTAVMMVLMMVDNWAEMSVA
jgi:hypothetical protein